MPARTEIGVETISGASDTNAKLDKIIELVSMDALQTVKSIPLKFIPLKTA